MDLSRLNPFKRRKEKRNAWIPWQSSRSDNKSHYLSGNLSQLKRCMSLYRDLLCSTPIVAMKDGKRVHHYLLDVLKKPNRYMSKFDLFTRLTESYWLEGNFYAYIDRDMSNRVQYLLPFTNGTIYAYATGKNNADPIRLNAPDAYHYISQFEEGKGDKKRIRTAKYLPEDILHIKSQWQSPDLLNGVSLIQAYTSTVELGQDCLETAQRYAQNGMIGPHTVSGIQEMPAKQKRLLENELENFFKDKGQYLTLDDKIELNSSIVQNPALFMQILSSMSTLHLCRLMSVPVSLVAREDGANTDVGVSMKESHRFFIKSSGRAWIQFIEEKLNELIAGEDVKLKFLWRSHQIADLREAQILTPLLDSKIISLDQAQEWLKD